MYQYNYKMSHISISIPQSKLSFGFDVDEDLNVTKIYNPIFIDHGLSVGDQLVYFQGYMLQKKSDILVAAQKSKEARMKNPLYPGDQPAFDFLFKKM